MRRLASVLIAGIALSISGCLDLNVDKLEEVARAIRDMQGQLDRTTGQGGHLFLLLEKAHSDVGDLIKLAEAAGGRLEEKVVLDFIDQKKQTIVEISELMKNTDVRFRGSLFGVTSDLSAVMGRLPRDLADQMTPLALLLPGFGTAPVRIEGAELTFRGEGYYTLVFDARFVEKLDVRVNHKEVITPRNRLGNRVKVEIPATSMAGLFRDEQREFVPFELIDHGSKQIRYSGSFDLKPIFSIKYSLRAFGPKGRVAVLHIENGQAIQAIVDAVAASMKVAIATRHGAIFEMARSRLAYGASEVNLPAGFEDYELRVVHEDGREETLVAQDREAGNVSWNAITRTKPDGSSFIHLAIKVRPPSGG